MNNWNLERLYKNEEEFNADFKKLDELATTLAGFKGKLNTKENLVEYANISEKFEQLLDKVYGYAHMSYDLNQKNQDALKRLGMVGSAYGKWGAMLSFIETELVANDKDTMLKWANEDPKLKEYVQPFRKMYDGRKHVLSDVEEKIIANYMEVNSGYNKLYDQVAVADNKSSDVKLTNGEVIVVNEGNFRKYLEELKDPTDRKNVFEAVFKFYGDRKNTFAGIYNGVMKAKYATVLNRGYSSILESALEPNAIPVSVYESLIETTKENSDLIKRYYAIRKEYFKLDKVHTYDRFLSFAESSVSYDYESCKKMFLECADKVGGEFASKAHQVVGDGIVDVNIKEGKRTGAYSTSIYGYGPFILLNHNGSLDSAFTLAHEAGHSMHTLFSSENQPYATSNYVIFVAEIASTFNEQLFLDYLIEKDIDKNTKIVLLQQAIDGLLGTFYRQALFADYEYQASKIVEQGGILTSDALSQIMCNLYKDYYGLDLKDEIYKEFVWAYIPHFFHSPFYVYQYATSFAASLAFYQKIKNNEPNAFENYIKLLKSGSEDYPVELVKKSGVDLTKKETFMGVVERFAFLLAELEKLLK